MEERKIMRPFEVFYDKDEGKYYIFAPTGCILVAGEAAEIKDAVNGNVELDSIGTALYAHVSEASGGGYEVDFDSMATLEGAEYDFKVCSFGSEDNDGLAYDLATSVVNLGGGSASVVDVSGAGCWCIVEDDTTQERHFGNKYYKFGEVVYEYTASNPELAQFNGSTVALKIDAAAPGTATIATYATFALFRAASLDAAYILKPLYTFESDGTVVTDWRNIPQAQAVEVLG